MAPYVVLDVDLSGGAFELVLVNSGESPAFSVEVSFKPELSALGGALDLAKLPLFQGLGVLRAGKEIRVFLDTAPAALARGPLRFNAYVSFRDDAGKQHRLEYPHDLGAYRGIPEIHSRSGVR